MRRDPPAEMRATPLDCEAALLECATGHEAAAASIYRSEVRWLRAVVHRIVPGREHADDIIHDAFVQMLRDARSFDPQRGSARAWIYTIVRNTALKSRRNAGREVALADEALYAMQDLQVLTAPPPRAAEYADLKNCLDALEPQRRASLILAIVDGRTHAEIATYLGVPVGTVKSWIRRELIALREQLK